MDILLADGRKILNATPADAAEMGVAGPDLNAAEAQAAAREARLALRAAIHQGAGDTLTLVGTNADGVAMLFVELAKLARDLAAASTVGEVNAAAQPLATLTASFLASVEDGSTDLPYLVKSDAPTTLAEMQARAHAAAAAFATQED